jgi:hypothetical protein
LGKHFVKSKWKFRNDFTSVKTMDLFGSHFQQLKLRRQWPEKTVDGRYKSVRKNWKEIPKNNVRGSPKSERQNSVRKRRTPERSNRYEQRTRQVPKNS